MTKTIFISIAAFNEPELQLTVDNALQMADEPDRLYFGITSHFDDMPHPNFDSYTNVKSAKLSYGGMLGMGICRSIANNFYLGQDYFLQIDGHTLFQQGWDTKVIDRFDLINKDYEKPIISNYVPWWSITKDNEIKNYNPHQEIHSAVIRYKRLGDPTISDDLYPQQNIDMIDWSKEIKGYREHANIAGHFIFTIPSFINDVAPDPQLFYSGEESMLATRAWTRGYRMFAIPEPIVWHKNKGDGYIHPRDRMGYPPTEDHLNFFIPKNDVSVERTRNFLTGNDFGYWGAPSKELLQNYERFAKIDFNAYYKKIDQGRG